MTQSYSPLVYMEGITRVFRDGDNEARVLAGIDLEIHPGEYVSIVGPSGCGKSTLLAIMGL
ncbi:MAG TPA: ATP-binding cassette domain-containing protein, partial [Blastocatellia bacterium]|nr:ATP-binding cassette domain-containing protein [Blastocatellia bacterium]